MNFKKWVKSIQTAGYNGSRTVNGRLTELADSILILGNQGVTWCPKMANMAAEYILQHKQSAIGKEQW